MRRMVLTVSVAHVDLPRQTEIEEPPGQGHARMKFLNPYVKVFLCVVGMLAMGYSLYPAFPSGLFDDAVTVVRGLVLCGFAYLLVGSLMEIVKSRGPRDQRD